MVGTKNKVLIDRIPGQLLRLAHSATFVVSSHRLPLIIFMLFVIFETILGQTFNTTWEWDAATRSMQGYEIATKGAGWYFFEGNGHYVWLPFWQLLIAFLYGFFHVNTILIGEVVSALCAGGTAVYLFVFLREFKLDEFHSALGSMSLLTLGFYVAYASQAMTESFSVFLFFACLYHLHRYFDNGALKNLAAASLTTLVNVATRYEAWLFVGLSAGFMLFFLPFSPKLRSRPVTVVHVILFLAPSVAFICLWLQYNVIMAAAPFAFRDWILVHNGHKDFIFYRDVGYTLITAVGNLFLALGVIWTSTLEELRQLRSQARGVRENVLLLFALLFLAYIMYYCYSIFTGFNSVYRPRHFLYFAPLSIIAFMLRKLDKPTLYVLLAFQIVLGVVAFALNIQAHTLYIETGQWPGNTP
mgnify:CR=1 FL=1